MKNDALQCGAGAKGSGQRDCTRQSWGDEIGNILTATTMDTRFDEANPLNLVNLTKLIKELKMFPYLRYFEFTDNTPDNETVTSGLGNISVNRQAKPLYQVVFTKGSCMHKSLYDKRNKSWNLIKVFEEGLLMADKGSYVRGFVTNPLNVETYRQQSGSDQERSIVNIQLADANEYNAENVFYTWDELGFTIDDLRGVIDLNVEFVNVPLAGDTSVTVKLTSACNGADTISTLDDPSLWVISGQSVNVAEINTTVVDGETHYILEVNSALNVGKITVSLFNNGNYVVEDASGELFKGTGSAVVGTPPSA